MVHYEQKLNSQKVDSVFKLHSYTRATQPDCKNRHLHVNTHRVVQEIPDTQSHCSMATRCKLQPCHCCFCEQWQDTPLGHHCLEIPRRWLVDSESCFAHYFTHWAHQLVHAGKESNIYRVLLHVYNIALDHCLWSVIFNWLYYVAHFLPDDLSI